MSTRQGWILSILFFFSGCASLMFELIWIRRLAFAFGCSIEATSAAVAAFMLGLGLGAYASGRWLTRLRYHPVLVFGCLELFVAASGLTILWLMGGYESLVASLAGRLSGSAFALVKVALVGMTLVLPCSAMGATLPLLTHYCHHTLRGEFAGWLGRLYAINTLGAITGVALTDFVLVEHWGMWRTGCLAAALDAGVGMLALLMSRQALIPTAEEGPESGGKFLPVAFVALFGSGMCGMLLQIFWTRLTVFLNGVQLGAYSLTLCAYLLGHLMGASLAGRLNWRGRPRLRLATAVTFCAVALTTAATMTLLGRLPRAQLSGELQQMLSNDLIIMLPATVGLGVLFVLASQLVKEEYASAGRSVGAAYLWNTAGSVLGSLLAGFVLVPLLGLQTSFYSTLGVTWALGLLLLASARQLLPALLLLGGSLAAAPWLAQWSLLQALTRIPPASVVYQGEDSYGSVTAAVQGDLALKETHTTLLVDGFMMAGLSLNSRHYTSASAALGVLLHPSPRRVLVVCLGVGNTLRAAVELSDCPVDCVELSPQVVEAARRLPPTREALESGRVDLRVGDGRHHLLTTPQVYDVIMTEPPPAQNAGAVNLYSREYFRLCRSRLAPQGVVVQWLPVLQLSTAELNSIFRAFSEVFPDCYLFHVGGHQFCLAGSDHPLVLNYPDFSRRLAEHRDFFQPIGLAEPELLVSSLAAGPAALAQRTAGRPPLTDDWPALHHSRRGARLDMESLLLSERRPWEQITIEQGDRARLESAWTALRYLNRLQHQQLCLPESYYLSHLAVKAFPNNPYFKATTLSNPANRAFYESRAQADPTARFEAARIAYVEGRLDDAQRGFETGLAQAPAVQAPFYKVCLGLVALARGQRPDFLHTALQGGLAPAEARFVQSLLTEGTAGGANK